MPRARSPPSADSIGLNAAQIRKDLAYFGDFGIRGVGYEVSLLRESLIHALGLDRHRAIVIAGAGNDRQRAVGVCRANTVVVPVDDEQATVVVDDGVGEGLKVARSLAFWHCLNWRKPGKNRGKERI